mmetsp:Transcript_51506/g.159749  ORF Transcript_51506/g.159749 Transcript_51506/m.159749 type:complete len:241 (+) Transcript_51506:234-956(+)
MAWGGTCNGPKSAPASSSRARPCRSLTTPARAPSPEFPTQAMRSPRCTGEFPALWPGWGASLPAASSASASFRAARTSLGFRAQSTTITRLDLSSASRSAVRRAPARSSGQSSGSRHTSANMPSVAAATAARTRTPRSLAKAPRSRSSPSPPPWDRTNSLWLLQAVRAAAAASSKPSRTFARSGGKPPACDSAHFHSASTSSRTQAGSSPAPSAPSPASDAELSAELSAGMGGKALPGEP